MEVFAIIGLLLLVIIIFAGGIIGWLFKGIGAIFELLLEGWGSCLRVVAWIVLILLFLLVLAL